MKVTYQNMDDAHRYYHNTFVEYDFLLGEGLRLYKLTVGGGHVKYHALTGGTSHEIPILEPGVSWNIEYIMPGKTLVMVKDPFKEKTYALLLSRKLDKQYKRGISYENSVMSMFVEGGLMEKEVNDKALHLWAGRYVIGPTRSAKLAVLKELKDKASTTLSVAFSDKVVLTKQGKLFVYETEVGLVDFHTNLATCNPLFYNEVWEAIGEILDIVSYRSERKGVPA